MLANNLQDAQVQPSCTEAPLGLMTIGALEIGATSFAIGMDVPAPTTLIGDEWEMIVVGDMLDEERIVVDGGEAIGGGKGGPFEGRKGFGEVLGCCREVERESSCREIRMTSKGHEQHKDVIRAHNNNCMCIKKLRLRLGLGGIPS